MTGRGGRRPRRSAGEAAQPAEEERLFRLAVYRFQDSAYAGLRSAIANIAIFFGFLGVFTLSIGSVDGAAIVPTVVLVLGGFAGVGYHLARGRRTAAAVLLMAAPAFTVIGLVVLVAVNLAG